MKNLYCIPNLNHIQEYINFSEEYNAGFEYNDFVLPTILDDTKKVDSLINAYLNLERDRSEDTLHGVFLDICINSTDKLIYEASDYRIHQSMDIAAKLGIKAVIFHTNHIPNFRTTSYRKTWLDCNIKYWTKLLAEYPNLNIYIENMFDEEPDLLLQLAEAFKEEPRFGVCLDFAHAYLSHTPLTEWANTLAPYTKHLHLNDNLKLEDTHFPVGSGTLPWNIYQDFIQSFSEENRPTALIEVSEYDALITSIAYMKEHGLYPF